jgi:hypothetical protein
VKGDEMSRACSTHGEKGLHIRVFTEGKRPLGRPRRRWKDNIRMDLREIGWRGMDWIDLAQAVEGCCEHGNEPSGSVKCWEILEQMNNCQLLNDSAPSSQLHFL